MVSLTELQEVPPKNMILLVGLPGSGKHSDPILFKHKLGKIRA